MLPTSKKEGKHGSDSQVQVWNCQGVRALPQAAPEPEEEIRHGKGKKSRGMPRGQSGEAGEQVYVWGEVCEEVPVQVGERWQINFITTMKLGSL